MEAILYQAANAVSLALEALALLVIVVGAAEATVGIVRLMFSSGGTNVRKRVVWLEFSHWLVAALTFQLAADIVRTMVVPGWNDLGKVAAIALIRTFLTYFLDRDIDSVRERNTRGEDRAAGA